jgi:hypothetical protein
VVFHASHRSHSSHGAPTTSVASLPLLAPSLVTHHSLLLSWSFVPQGQNDFSPGFQAGGKDARPNMGFLFCSRVPQELTKGRARYRRQRRPVSFRTPFRHVPVCPASMAVMNLVSRVATSPDVLAVLVSLPNTLDSSLLSLPAGLRVPRLACPAVRLNLRLPPCFPCRRGRFTLSPPHVVTLLALSNAEGSVVPRPAVLGRPVASCAPPRPTRYASPLPPHVPRRSYIACVPFVPSPAAATRAPAKVSAVDFAVTTND